jgi:hypothetical protein
MDGMGKLTVREASREVPVREEVDVVVCGGGSSGVAAALAAARMGMRVSLVESYGFLGGVNTAAGVNGVGGWQHDLDGRPLIQGIPMMIMKELAKRGGAEIQTVEEVFRPKDKRPSYREGGLGCYWIRTNPDYMKITLDALMEEAGVRLLYHALAVMPIMDGEKVKGVFVESKSGRQAILAKVVIDCTGDGDIAARAGAEYDIGRPDDGYCQPMSLIFTVGNADLPELNYKLGSDESHLDPLERNRYEGAIKLARERGEIVLNPNELFCSATPVNNRFKDVRSVNFTRIQKMDATNADDLTRAEIIGRKQVVETLNFMRKYVRNCENAYLINILPQVGIRESRRIRGEYTVTGDDVMNGARFPDAIARGIYLLDIHNVSGVNASTLQMLDQPYDIPYRSLVPKGIDNLLVAGRCISGDHIALASFRIQSHCMAVGEAAGTAAALAVSSNKKPSDIEIEKLREQLTKNGCNVGMGI